ncbi:MAG: beta-lactamase family protein [archaeon]|nr:beta-lactamase family protein [archaeon]
MKISEAMIHGSVEPGFEKVKEIFIESFKKGEEVGAACAVYHKGKKVVDLWGGYRDKKSKDPWKEDTMVCVFSTTKGMSSLAVALAISKGYFDVDEKVCKYWPEFAQNGKDNITIRQLLSHQAGLCAIDEPMDLEILGNTERMSQNIAAQKPLWEPGKKHGYHAITLGWYESELIRKTDPQHRTVGQFFRDEIAKPLGIEFYIGLPDEIPDSRIANIHAPMYKFRMIFNMDKLPKQFVRAMLKKGTITERAFSNPKILGEILKYNTREMRKIELPASNGIGLVRDIAKLYGIFATGGKELGIKPEVLEALEQPAKPPERGLFDEVLLIETLFSLGFLKQFPSFEFGTSVKAFGTPGAGGSFGYADPDTQTGFAYAMNKSGYYIYSDPRETVLSDAVFECIKNL